ncbi:flagellar basal-body MS-ring/collar protein FliF [Amaricoccus macauensis]|uniref:flagellar basal-body MS-ring/collar protein FliF n=1 Tax=Amaricoccus macauensis TaxID=57001 RepID=UPI003C7E726E
MPTKIQTIWESLEPRQRLIAILSAVGIIATMFGISKIATAPDNALLYSGLDPSASGEVVAALEAEGVQFEVRNNSIYVDRSERDRLRMNLAAEGLPAGGPAGYEILDGLSGFGTTSQMFDAAYWRAKEGELARTIATSPNVRAARVHIANPIQQPFSRTQTGSASVTVTMAGGSLQTDQAEAIRNLVSSAVAGLNAQDVAVIDSINGVVLSGDLDDMAKAGITKPDERAEKLRQNILRLLEARVGKGRAIVEVNVDASMDSQTISERRIDPESRVAISSETEQSTEQSSGPAPGVTVASNLPDGDVEGGAGESSRTANETRERQNFEVSETRSERVILPGQVQRINVAVMVDGIVATDEGGEQSWQPRPQDEMDTLRQLVETAAGFDPARGDTVTIESLQFTAAPEQGTLVEGGQESFMKIYGARLIQIGVLGSIILALIFFVLRPMMSRQPAPLIGELAGEDGAMIEGNDQAPAQIGVSEGSAEEGDFLEDLPAKSLSKIDRLKEVISDRSEDSARVLRNWIETPEGQKEPAG